jgi:hypothetical protein
MNSYDDRRPAPPRVREPVQVYLDPDDQQRLERLRSRLATSKSDVLRRGLESLERELTDPDAHPALRIIGLGESTPAGGAAAPDAARDHDAVLADAEQSSWHELRRERS